jgi:putative endonuclease
VWYVYIIESNLDNKHYIGSTNDLKRRIQEHNSGDVIATAPRRPFELVSYISVKTEKQSRCLEQFLKTGSGYSFIKKRLLQAD